MEGKNPNENSSEGLTKGQPVLTVCMELHKHTQINSTYFLEISLMQPIKFDVLSYSCVWLIAHLDLSSFFTVCNILATVVNL